MTVDQPAPPDRLGRWWSLLRVALLVTWLAAAAAGWWSAPRQASYDEAKAAVAEHRLTTYQWGNSWESDGPRPWFDRPTVTSTSTQGPMFVWRTGDGRVRWADTDAFDEVTLTGVVDRDDYSGAGAAGIAEKLMAAGLEHRVGTADGHSPWVNGAGLVLALVFLGVVVAGPAPVLGTRWFWFWLVWMAPYGLGLVFWVVRDRPWSRTARARSPLKVGGGDLRDRGWLGLMLGVLAWLLLSVVVAMLNGLLGDQWVPQASGR